MGKGRHCPDCGSHEGEEHLDMPHEQPPRERMVLGQHDHTHDGRPMPGMFTFTRQRLERDMKDPDPLSGLSMEGRVIIRHLLPKWQFVFEEKNRKYRRVQHLGPKGVFPDINRKVGIIKDRIWDGNNSPGEPTSEVISDLIGHLFLMWALLEDEGDED